MFWDCLVTSDDQADKRFVVEANTRKLAMKAAVEKVMAMGARRNVACVECRRVKDEGRIFHLRNMKAL